jgi:flavin-dependent thymidylate synthase
MNNTNKVILIGHYGGDITHACSAWTSTYRELTDEKRARIPKMLRSLAADGHHTPFEKSALHFLITVDQATHIHLLKHRVGVSINAESARYKELKDDKAHIPSDWPAGEAFILEQFQQECFRKYHDCITILTSRGFSRKRAKESARYYLPMCSQIQMDVMFNWRSFAHFIVLRRSPHAQVEIREVATAMLDCVKQIEGNPFEHTIAAFEQTVWKTESNQ